MDFCQIQEALPDIEVVRLQVTSATVRWRKIKMNSRSNVLIRYVPTDIEDVKYEKMDPGQDEIELTNLLPCREYNLTVLKDQGDGEISKMYSIKFKTKESIAKRIKSESKKIAASSRDTKSVYKVIPKNIVQLTPHVRDLMILEEEDVTRRMMNMEKTVLFLGATGSGKTTMIDAIFNYLAQVSFGDKFRFQLTDLLEHEKKRVNNQVISQTSAITCYRIPKSDKLANEYSLNIIDTPGFGDTSDQDFEARIRSQMHDLFTEGIQKIHAICIVIPKASFRLTPLQKQIFDSIPRLFGKDVEEIIYCIMTFDDGGEPHVLSTLNAMGIPIKDSFSFNNGSFKYNNISRNDEIIFSQWNKNCENMKKFFEEVYRSDGISICRSQEVLGAIKRTLIKLQDVRNNIGIQLQCINNLKRENKILAEIREKGEHFLEYEVEIPEKRKVRTPNSRRIAINCATCKNTCHNECSVPINMFVGLCSVFNWRSCTICECKGSPSCHSLESEMYKIVYITEKRTNSDLKKKYESVAQGKEKLKKQLVDLHLSIQCMQDLISEIREKALKSKEMSFEKFVDVLIKDETNDCQQGYSDRIEFYERIKCQVGNGLSVASDRFLESLMQ